MTTTANRIVQVVRRMVEMIVAYPEHVVVNANELRGVLLVKIQSRHAADTPRIIGKGAATFNALAAFISAACERNGMRALLPMVGEPEFGEPERYKFKPRRDWPQAEVTVLIQDAADLVFNGNAKLIARHDDDSVSSIYAVIVPKNEPAEMVDAARSAFSRIFDAVGRASGRLVAVNICPEGPVKSAFDEQQPASAAGRFVGETEPKRKRNP